MGLEDHTLSSLPQPKDPDNLYLQTEEEKLEASRQSLWVCACTSLYLLPQASLFRRISCSFL